MSYHADKISKKVLSEFPDIRKYRIGRIIIKKLKESPPRLEDYDEVMIINSIRKAIQREIFAFPTKATGPNLKKTSLDQIERMLDEGNYAGKYGLWWDE